MWAYQHSVETTAAPEVLWRHWSAVAQWPEWNAGVARISIDGPFEAGTSFTMTPPGEEPLRMRLTEVVPGKLFTDELDAGEFVVRTVHSLEPGAAGTTRVVYRTEISGPAADAVGPQVGPAITADFPDVLAALVRLAES
ncbi:SRPBCC family protein [Dactylosporangium sp. NPDC051541]|uniref:SRPBCC family protein n=1 Tax=Dactylosporangium sp. NPDC051541 TaxID=3363977 RepID=UPI003798AA72